MIILHQNIENKNFVLENAKTIIVIKKVKLKELIFVQNVESYIYQKIKNQYFAVELVPMKINKKESL